MATIPWLGDVLRAAGIQVIEEGDWRARGRPGAFEPIGVLWHHTASTSSPSRPAPSLSVVINGRSDLPGPLCHALVDYNGVFRLIAAGRANHAGRSGGSGPIPVGDGNTMLIGWEIDYAGDQPSGPDQAMTPAQYTASVKATAAVLRRLGRDASFARGHRETSTTGKPDPSFVNLDTMRADVARELAGSNPGTPAAAGVQAMRWDDEIQVFATGVDQRAHQKVWSPRSDWSGWYDLEGGIVGRPETLTYNDEIHVFATGTDARVHQNVWNRSAGWSGWYDLDGGAVGSPQPLVYNDEIHVFVTGTDTRVHQKVWRPGADWSGWYDLDGGVVGPPQILVYHGEIQLFVTGTDKRVHQKVWSASADWSGWYDLGGGVVGPPQPLEYNNDVHVFATGVDGRMHQAVWNAASGWAGWYDLDGGIVGPPELLTYNSDIHIFAVGTDKHLHQKVWSPSNSWSGWYDLQGTLQ